MYFSRAPHGKTLRNSFGNYRSYKERLPGEAFELPHHCQRLPATELPDSARVPVDQHQDLGLGIFVAVSV